MVCIIKNDPVNKKNLEDLTKIVGSELAAYYLLCANNGWPMDKTPTGENSGLYSELLNVFGDPKDAILAKAQAYLPEYGNWVDDPESTSLKLDELGEPCYTLLIKVETPDDKDGSIAKIEPNINASSISEILNDNGELLQILEIYRDHNILDREYAIEEAITRGRDSFAAKYIEELSKFEPVSTVAKYLASIDAKMEWDTRMRDKIIYRILETLAKTFNLKKVRKGYYVGFEGDETTDQGKVKVRFVNNISKYLKEADEKTKGAYSEDMNHLMSMLYISLKNGDHTTIVHELAHRYIRKFWDTLPVQDALKVIENRKTKGNIVQIEESLIQKLIDLLENDGKQNASFWGKINKMLNNLIPYNKTKTEILDELVAYFSINKDLSRLAAETIYFDKMYQTMFLNDATLEEKDIVTNIRKGIDRRIKAMTYEPTKNNKVIADMLLLDESIEKLDSTDPDDVSEAIRYVLNACKKELLETGLFLRNAGQGDLSSIDIDHFYRLKINTLGFYYDLIHNKINDIFDSKNNHDAFKRTSALYGYFISIKSQLTIQVDEYNLIAKKWAFNFIDEKAEEIVDFTDKEIWKYNAKKWLLNEIRYGDLGRLNQLFGAINSESPIINLIDHLTRRWKNEIRPDVQAKGHELVTLFDKYTNHWTFLPKNSFTNFIEYTSRNWTGRKKMTGNFRRSENWGEMQYEVDKETKRVAKKLGIELDEHLKFDWQEVTEDLYKEFHKAMNEFYKNNDIIRPYKPEYYDLELQYLSVDTIERRRELRRLINLLESKCKNQKTGIIEIFNLTQSERDTLKNIKEELSELSNPYIIEKDAQGNIISIKEKDPDSTDGIMAKELIEFRNATRGRLQYYPNDAAYKKDLDQLKKDNASRAQIALFSEYNTVKQIKSGLIVSGGPRTKELAMLYAKRQSIINAIKPARGYWLQNLDLLNDEAWAELKEIDETITELEKELVENDIPISKGSITDEKAGVQKAGVLLYENGQPNSTEYLTYKWLREVEQMRAVNPNAEDEYYNKYYYNKWILLKEKDLDGKNKWELVRAPLEATQIMVVSNPDYVLYEPIGKYIIAGGALAEMGYNSTEFSFIQPRPGGKWHDAEFVKLYGNGNTEYALLYKKFIEIMGETYKNYGLVDTNKYQLPGIRDDGNHSFYRRGYISASLIKDRLGLNESDDNYNEELVLRPDGELVRTIPMRYINKLKDPNMTSTDLIMAVMKMYECSLMYKSKNETLPTIETLMIPMEGVKNSLQYQYIRNYLDMYYYDRKRRIDKHGSQFLNKFADVAMKKAHSKLMSHKWHVVIKNAADSFYNFLKEMAGGKYFTFKDSFIQGGHLIAELISIWKPNVNRANPRTLTGAILQRNGVSGSTEEIFKGQRSSAIRRFLAKHFRMGEYTFVDYLWKGIIARSVYHNHRLMTNPVTGKKLFLNKWQASYLYAKAGKTEKEGRRAWTKAGGILNKKSVTLIDAVYVDKEGNLKIKDQYLDIIRPKDKNGKETNLLETRIETIIRERSSVINGVLDEMDRSYFMASTIGALVCLMRGWMFSLSADNYKYVHQLRLMEEDLDREEFEGREFKPNHESKRINKKGEVKITRWYEDEELDGLANLSSGFTENGVFRGGLLRAYGRCISTFLYLNKLINVNKPTKHQRYQARSMSVSVLAMAMVIALSVLFGKQLEKDPDDLLYNTTYAINTGLMSERVSLLPGGVVISMMELIRSITITKSLYDDADYIPKLVVDGVQYYLYTHGMINTSDYDKIIPRDTYKGFKVWLRDLLKATSVLIPEININNILMNANVQQKKSSSNFFNDQFPVTWFNYRPQNGSTRSTNITTYLFADTEAPQLPNDRSVWEWLLNLKGLPF